MIPWGYIGLGGALAATLIGAWIHDLRREAAHGREVTSLNKQIQDWKDAHDQLGDAVAKQREDQLAQQLRENEERDQRERDFRTANDQLRRAAAAAQARNKDLGDELLRRLAATPKSPESRLDDGTRDYYRGLREQQCAAADGPGRAAAGCAESGRVP